MDIKITESEYEIFMSAANDFLINGSTSRKCPRCGKEILCEHYGTSYIIKCKSDNCIKIVSRGI